MRVEVLVALALVTTVGAVGLAAQKGGGSGGGGGGRVTTPVKTTVGAELRLSRESANPNGIAQIKVSLTEPKPISTGFYDFSGGFDDFMGISLFDPTSTTYGLAWLGQNGVRVVTSSPFSTLGLAANYPILTLTVRVSASSQLGSQLPVHLDPSLLRLVDATGTPYPTKVTDGSISVQTTAAIEDVIPGSDEVPAGGVVRLLGHNLTPDLKVRLADTKARQVLFMGPNEIDVVVDGPTVMHSREVRVQTSTSKSSYFSYQRTHADVTSSFPVLRTFEPVFPEASSTLTTLAFPGASSNLLQSVLVQNSHLDPVTVTFSRQDASGSIEAGPEIAIGGAGRLALALEEIFSSPCAGGCVVTISGSASLHAMGVIADQAMTAVKLVVPQ